MIETEIERVGHETATLALTVSNQLNSLMEQVQQLLRVPLVPELESALLRIEDQGLACRATLRDALVQAHRSAPRTALLDPGRLLARAFEWAEPRARAAGVRVLLGSSPELPRLVCDPVVLEHAVLLVLLCAIGAVKEGGGEVQVLAEGVVDGGIPSVRVTVSDGRPGPPLARLPDLGTPGGGFGLDVARDAVVDHGGRFEIGPSSTGGFVVAMTLPGATGDRELTVA